MIYIYYVLIIIYKEVLQVNEYYVVWKNQKITHFKVTILRYKILYDYNIIRVHS